MNWDAVGAIGEIVGALAVVVSLLYLAIQIKAQNKQAKVDALHEISLGFRDATGRFANEDIAEVFTRANGDFDSLSDAEAFRLVVLTGGIFRAWEEAFIQHVDGNLDVRGWETISRHYINIMGAPAIRRVWTMRQSTFDPGFQEYVNELQTTEYFVK